MGSLRTSSLDVFCRLIMWTLRFSLVMGVVSEGTSSGNTGQGRL